MVDHHSSSQIDMFWRCHRQRIYRYEQGLRLPPGLALILGGSVHGAAELNFRAKLISRVDEPVDVLVDAAVTRYNERLREDGILLSRDDLPAKDRILSEHKDKAVQLTKVFAADVAPGTQPALVEERLEMSLPGVDKTVIGYVDVYTEDRRLTDLKTSKRKWPKLRPHTETQPTVYAEMIRQLEGSYPDRVTFDVLVHTKTKGCYHQPLDTTRGPDDIAALARRVQIMEAMQKAGNYPGAKPERDWWCSHTWCGYWGICDLIPDRLRRLPNVA